MAEYVERETVVNNLELLARHEDRFRQSVILGIVETIRAMEAVDVAPVVHGRWIRPHWKNNNYCCDCSECGGEAMHRDYQWDKNGVYPICPNCGAKMDGGADHEDD